MLKSTYSSFSFRSSATSRRSSGETFLPLQGTSALSAEEVCGSGACVGQDDDWWLWWCWWLALHGNSALSAEEVCPCCADAQMLMFKCTKGTSALSAEEVGVSGADADVQKLVVLIAARHIRYVCWRGWCCWCWCSNARKFWGNATKTNLHNNINASRQCDKHSSEWKRAHVAWRKNIAVDKKTPQRQPQGALKKTPPFHASLILKSISCIFVMSKQSWCLNNITQLNGNL